VMSSRRFTAQCLRASTEKDSTTGGSVAVRDFSPAFVRFGSWLCENSNARRARRNISKKLRIMESNRAARTMFDTLSENCIFYISQLYEFSHRLGQKQTSPSTQAMSALPPKADIRFCASLMKLAGKIAGARTQQVRVIERDQAESVIDVEALIG